jgi:hypothetical protein
VYCGVDCMIGPRRLLYAVGAALVKSDGRESEGAVEEEWRREGEGEGGRTASLQYLRGTSWHIYTQLACQRR